MTKAQGPEVTSELRECPFCGKSDAFVERADFSSCYVMCNDCAARGPTSCDENADDAHASESGVCEPGELPARRLWNTRATQPQSLTIDEETVERAASAISLEDVNYDFDLLGQSTKEHYRRMARAGLAAAIRARSDRVDNEEQPK